MKEHEYHLLFILSLFYVKYKYTLFRHCYTFSYLLFSISKLHVVNTNLILK